jgi:hypothetical protein
MAEAIRAVAQGADCFYERFCFFLGFGNWAFGGVFRCTIVLGSYCVPGKTWRKKKLEHLYHHF